MIEIKQVKTQDEVNYTFVEKLMHTAFPQEERRDTVQQREYSDNNPRFCNNIILENGNSIGMISYWTMGDFTISNISLLIPASETEGMETCAGNDKKTVKRSNCIGSRGA